MPRDAKANAGVLAVSVLLMVGAVAALLLTGVPEWYDLFLVGLVFVLAAVGLGLEIAAFEARAGNSFGSWVAKRAPVAVLGSLIAAIVRGPVVPLAR